MPECIPAEKYIDRILEIIVTADERIIIKTMTFSVGDRWAEVVNQLVLACIRGVDVELHLDRYAVVGMNRRSWGALWMLQKHGVNITWHGSIRLNPFAGRDHTKFVIIDETVFGFGGINVKESALDAIDYMIELYDKRVASWLYESLNQTSLKKLHCRGTVYYLDTGRAGKSIIYRRALEIVSSSREVTYMSKMAPNGALALLLQIKNTSYYYNSLNAPRLSVVSKLAVFFDERKSKERSLYKGSRYIHAKCIIGTAGNKATLLSGSHNFNERGVIYGTRECALETSDKKLIKSISSYITTSVK